MTDLQDVIGDPKYKKVLDHGFVGLVDYMGSDDRVAQAARTSYGQGTKSVRGNRGLIRYLMKHQHTSPFEQCVLTFHIKLPIFVMRQLVRHRTAALNELSGRYSELPNQFYIPEFKELKPQSQNNNQGRSGELTDEAKSEILRLLNESNEFAYTSYEELLDGRHGIMELSEEYPGLARELSRMVLPVSLYTECYWTINLRNFFHYYGLRADSHAQKEIQDYANTKLSLIEPLFPESVNAARDYMWQARTQSRMERKLLKNLFILAKSGPLNTAWEAFVMLHEDSEDKILEVYSMTRRELDEFKQEWGF